MTALRELAELRECLNVAVRAVNAPLLTDKSNEQAGWAAVSFLQSHGAQLLSILDAEGDGGAVGDEVVDRVAKAIADAAGHGMREKCEHMAHAAISAYRLATWPETHPARSGVARDEDVLYIDCEFDGHNGPLLSLAIVAQDGRSIHVRTDAAATDPWVIENVMPLMDSHKATRAIQVPTNSVGTEIRRFLAGIIRPVIVADSPADIARFCNALSTSSSGQWESANYPRMTFRVENVDCYPTSLAGAVQHNAWWDAMALHAALTHFAKGERHER